MTVELGYRDRADALVGYREWVPVETPAGWLLRSLWSDTIWRPGEVVEARCFPGYGLMNRWRWDTYQRANPHRFAPDPRCACGLFGLRHYPRAMSRAVDVGPRSVGRVRGWGVMVLGDDAWRSQYAHVEVLLELTGASDPELLGRIVDRRNREQLPGL